MLRTCPLLVDYFERSANRLDFPAKMSMITTEIVSRIESDLTERRAHCISVFSLYYCCDRLLIYIGQCLHFDILFERIIQSLNIDPDEILLDKQWEKWMSIYLSHFRITHKSPNLRVSRLASTQINELLYWELPSFVDCSRFYFSARKCSEHFVHSDFA